MSGLQEKRIRARKYKRKLKKLYPYSLDIWRIDKNYHYKTIKKPYYRKRHRGRISSYCKKQTNKIIRQYKGEIPNGGSYRKLFDMWWEMY